jgi:hypothetical protein
MNVLLVTRYSKQVQAGGAPTRAGDTNPVHVLVLT